MPYRDKATGLKNIREGRKPLISGHFRVIHVSISTRKAVKFLKWTSYFQPDPIRTHKRAIKLYSALFWCATLCFSTLEIIRNAYLSDLNNIFLVGMPFAKHMYRSWSRKVALLQPPASTNSLNAESVLAVFSQLWTVRLFSGSPWSNINAPHC